MSITRVEGDILLSSAYALVNPVNCYGVMGKGLALQFKRAYPEMFKSYVRSCAWLKPGLLHKHEVSPERCIINFPTKDHWKDPSKVAYVVAGLDALRAMIERDGIRTLALPALGTGAGGLDWLEVEPLIVSVLGGLENTRTELYVPVQTSGQRGG